MASNSAFKAYLSLIPKLDDQAENDIKRDLSKVDTEPAGRSMGSKIAKGMGAAAVAGAAAAAAAVGAIIKQSIDAYADYEQLAGGVETLFGDAADTVIANAQRAYETAGMSANQYMETVTSFSASLLQSLGGDTQAAAQKADLALTDMSDNANKMGTSMESIQNAYQGFAKQNYTMLDNLKLGYGGTKQEMERLLADAEAISGVHYDVSQYADIVDAIHVVQTEMGITGTTAEEAASTISGSIGMAKAAYTNWITALADENADLVGVTDNLIDAVVTAVSNVSTIIPQILGSILRSLPKLLEGLAPMVTQTILELAPALIEALPGFIEAGLQLFTALITALDEIVPQLIEMIPVIIPQITQALLDNLPLLIAAAVQLFIGIITGLWQALPSIVQALFEAGNQIVQGLKDGIKAKADSIFDGLKNAISNGIQWIKNLLGIASPSKVFAEIGMNTMLGYEKGIKDATPRALRAMEDATAAVSAAGVVGMALDGTTGAQRGIGGNVVYINGAQVNDTPGIQTALVDFLLDLKRLGVMEEGAIA